SNKESNAFVTVCAFIFGSTLVNNLREQRSTTVTKTDVVPLGPTTVSISQSPKYRKYSY
ncbi:TPA: hypothetical protein RHK04_002681, partial [Enterococcus faecalis]|nr:hypothetical protein [Enterococcus faecalis]